MPNIHPTPPERAAAVAVPPTGPLPAALTQITPRKRLNSQTLLGDEREIEIEHAGQLYRLRLTSLGKLILTK